MSMHTSMQKKESADEKKNALFVIMSNWIFMLRPPGLMETVD